VETAEVSNTKLAAATRIPAPRVAVRLGRDRSCRRRNRPIDQTFPRPASEDILLPRYLGWMYIVTI
jgi:hypothetical protein